MCIEMCVKARVIVAVVRIRRYFGDGETRGKEYTVQNADYCDEDGDLDWREVSETFTLLNEREVEVK